MCEEWLKIHPSSAPDDPKPFALPVAKPAAGGDAQTQKPPPGPLGATQTRPELPAHGLTPANGSQGAHGPAGPSGSARCRVCGNPRTVEPDGSWRCVGGHFGTDVHTDDVPLPPVPRDLFGNIEPEAEAPKAASAPKRYKPFGRTDVPAAAASPKDDKEAPKGLSELDPGWVESLEKSGLEVELKTSGPSVTLVATRTGKARVEVTFREALVLRAALQAFPGSQITAITKGESSDVDELEEDS